MFILWDKTHNEESHRAIFLVYENSERNNSHSQIDVGGSDSLNVERVALDMTNQEWMNIMLQGLNKKILEKITYQRNGLGNIPTNLQKVEINQSFWPRQKCYFVGEQNSTFNVLLSFVADAFGNTAQLQPQFLHPVSSTMTNLGTHLDQYIPSAYSLDWLKQKPLRVWLRICT